MTSTIKVNTITSCGSTLTIGGAGKTVSIASGATTSGMGRAGTVDWCSTIYTNSPGTVTGVSGKGYFLNTTSGAITINLPSSPSVGDIISIKDYANTFDTNKTIIGRGGSKIYGNCLDADLNTEGQTVTLIYADSTKGWINIQNDTTIQGNNFINATGGTITTSGDYKIHTFNSDANFVVSGVGPAGVGNKTSYLVVAGAGSGGSSDNANMGAAGGAGGFREGKCSSDPYADSPLDSGTALTVTAQSYPITVGAGGGAVTGQNIGNVGSNSIYSTITSAGGGYGGSGNPVRAGGNGGSGGGGGGGSSAIAGGSGNTPPVSPPQGNNGGSSRPAPGTSYDSSSGGGGGAGGVGGPSPDGNTAGAGGAHINTSISASDTEYAGGAGGSAGGTPGCRGTPGGGGAGNGSKPGGANAATAGTANTGGSGGGGGSPNTTSGAGGSGVVVIRYKFQ